MIGKKIKDLRIASGKTQKELAGSLGISIVTLRTWETGSRTPPVPALIRIAEIFELPTEYLIGTEYDRFEANASEIELIRKYRTLDSYGKDMVNSVLAMELNRVEKQKTNRAVPITAARYIPKYLTPSAAGRSVPLDGEDFEMIPVNESVPMNADYAVRIQGNSMSPYILDGDTVYVRKQDTIKVGDVGIFNIDGAMYCKIYYTDDDKNLTLISANPEMQDANVFVSADSSVSVRCLGKVLLDHKIPMPGTFEK